MPERRGHGVDKTRVLISGTRRGLTSKLLADLRRRSAIEPEIGHMKADGRLSRCTLKGTIGDALLQSFAAAAITSARSSPICELCMP
jgi:IS5 family transposase